MVESELSETSLFVQLTTCTRCPTAHILHPRKCSWDTLDSSNTLDSWDTLDSWYTQDSWDILDSWDMLDSWDTGLMGHAVGHENSSSRSLLATLYILSLIHI